MCLMPRFHLILPGSRRRFGAAGILYLCVSQR
jgi:hypothetical protein